jgi:dihydropteroate synthase
MGLAVEHVSGAAKPRATAIMGILNCTPDSFSDGVVHATMVEAVAAAVVRAQQMLSEGAAWLDVGGESSRPGATPVSAAVEAARVVPVIAALRQAGITVPVSIDTTKATVAEAALKAGATAINDISAGADPRMFTVAAAAGCELILMHMAGTPGTMQQSPQYVDIASEVECFLGVRVAAAMAAGVARERLFIDPGIGFGKTVAHNLALLRTLPSLGTNLALPVVLGLSRKRFLALTAGTAYPADDCLGHPLHALLAPWCALLRVHDVAGTMRALRAAELA